ncbi:MAG: hypothetical protein A2Y17_12725 [Clostridiales bacterium GWF2_38_85]|nr:MAG: hypothetical protein A2Y17_12725 [Clostridiales bacterium GWF2_38_85]HBL84123.1 FAD/NAD(P)-binding oxidoreductase [Clostridiales bacterium]
MFDIAIIGAGVSGCMLARSLSRYKLRVCVLESSYDVAGGASRANSAIIHAGYDPVPGTLKAKLNVRGAELMKTVVRELGVEYRELPSIVLAYDDEQMKTVRELKARAEANNVKAVRIIGKDEILKLEPKVNPEIVGALYADSAIVCPYGLTIAAAENAAANGVEFRLNFEVTDIKFENNEFIINNEIKAKYVVNAAGVNSGKISTLIGDTSFKITPRRGEYLIYDKKSLCVSSVLFTVPTKLGKGVLVAPSVSGNMLVGPNSEKVEDEAERSTTVKGQDFVFNNARRILPVLTKRGVINEFAGVRAIPDTDDFIIGFSDKNPCFLQVAGIESPGLASSPAIAEYATELLKQAGVMMIENPDATMLRKQFPRIADATPDEAEELIKQNSLYAHIICRCETISEAEIVTAIHRPLGARSIDGVKFRTRAGMGRCQGGFCLPKITEILARELKIPIEEVTKFGGNSQILYS